MRIVLSKRYTFKSLKKGAGKFDAMIASRRRAARV